MLPLLVLQNMRSLQCGHTCADIWNGAGILLITFLLYAGTVCTSSLSRAAWWDQRIASCRSRPLHWQAFLPKWQCVGGHGNMAARLGWWMVG